MVTAYIVLLSLICLSFALIVFFSFKTKENKKKILERVQSLEDFPTMHPNELKGLYEKIEKLESMNGLHEERLTTLVDYVTHLETKIKETLLKNRRK